MTYEEFLTKAIDKGIDAAKRDYAKPEDKARLDGSIAGFEACRGKNPIELRDLMWDARTKTQTAFHRVHEKEITDEEYWKIRCFEAEVEWTCNVVSAILANSGGPALDPLMPTARAVICASEIVGVKEGPPVGR
jgi:hypothetical protein